MRRLTLITMMPLVLFLAGHSAEAQGRRNPWIEKPASLESTHPYPASANDQTAIREPGVAEIRIHFARIEMEEGFDFLEVRDGRGELVERYTGEQKDIWTPPVAGDTVVIQLLSDENVSRWGFLVDRVAHRGPVEVVSNVHTLRFELPRGPSLKAGRSAPLRVVGLGPTGAPIELTGHPIYFNIRGPVQILAVDLPERYKIVAAEDLRVEEEAVITAYSGRSSKISGQFTLRVIPARPLASLVLSCRVREIQAGGSTEFSIVGKPLEGRGGPQAIAPGEVQIGLSGPGRIVPMPGGRGARFRYEAPPALGAARSVVITAHLGEDPQIRGKLFLVLRRRVYARPGTVPEARDLVKITDYATREDASSPWKRRDLPGLGEVFRNRLQNQRFRFVVNRRPVLQVEVDILPANDPRAAVRHPEEDGALTVEYGERGASGEIKGQFREGRGEYLITFYVWTAPDRVERQSIRVLRARRGK